VPYAAVPGPGTGTAPRSPPSTGRSTSTAANSPFGCGTGCTRIDTVRPELRSRRTVRSREPHSSARSRSSSSSASRTSARARVLTTNSRRLTATTRPRWRRSAAENASNSARSPSVRLASSWVSIDRPISTTSGSSAAEPYSRRQCTPSDPAYRLVNGSRMITPVVVRISESVRKCSVPEMMNACWVSWAQPSPFVPIRSSAKHMPGRRFCRCTRHAVGKSPTATVSSRHARSARNPQQLRSAISSLSRFMIGWATAANRECEGKSKSSSMT